MGAGVDFPFLLLETTNAYLMVLEVVLINKKSGQIWATWFNNFKVKNDLEFFGSQTM